MLWNLGPLRQDVEGDGAGRPGVNSQNSVSAAGGAARPVAGSAAQVRSEHSGSRNRRGELLILQRPLLFRAVDLAQVVDARIFLRRSASAHEVGNRDGGQKTNDGHNNHDFHQREARLARSIDSHTSSNCLSVITA